jgi:hypothetical protein
MRGSCLKCSLVIAVLFGVIAEASGQDAPQFSESNRSSAVLCRCSRRRCAAVTGG